MGQEYDLSSSMSEFLGDCSSDAGCTALGIFSFGDAGCMRYSSLPLSGLLSNASSAPRHFSLHRSRASRGILGQAMVGS